MSIVSASHKQAKHVSDIHMSLAESKWCCQWNAKNLRKYAKKLASRSNRRYAKAIISEEIEMDGEN